MKKGGLYIFLIGLLLSLTVFLLFHFLYYSPHQKDIVRLKSKIRELERNIKTQENSNKMAKESIANMKLGIVNLNYFNHNHIADEDKIAFFLKVLNNYANNIGISFMSISPKISVEKKGYFKESFEIYIKTDFHKLLLLLDQLQNIIGVNIDRLVIKRDEIAQKQETTAIIGLNSIEMKNRDDKDPSTLEELRQMHFKRDINLHDINLGKNKNIGDVISASFVLPKGIRDPFVKPEKIAQLQEKLIQIEKELGESKLLGIIEFEGEKHAIIGRHTVKKGDSIFDLEVEEITSDSVILGDRGLRFTYHLKNKK